MQPHPSAPIVLFDSGIGGFSVLDAVQEALPDAPIVYAADYAGLPYGAKSEAQVAARVAGLLGRIAERFAPRLICIACNTASTIALGMVRDVLEIPIVGTVPAIKPAAAATRSGTIGLLGTSATIRQPYIDDLERDFASDKALLRLAAPQLVDLAEAAMRGEVLDPSAFERLAKAMRQLPGGEKVDTLVLACTHFPLVSDAIAAAFGSDIALIDGADGIARRIASLLEGQEFKREGPHRLIHTGALPGADDLADALLARGFGAPLRL